jgi:hypothetical protein
LCQHFVSTFSPNSTCSTEQLAVCVDKKRIIRLTLGLLDIANV